jgi:hypothetical protein
MQVKSIVPFALILKQKNKKSKKRAFNACEKDLIDFFYLTEERYGCEYRKST